MKIVVLLLFVMSTGCSRIERRFDQAQEVYKQYKELKRLKKQYLPNSIAALDKHVNI